MQQAMIGIACMVPGRHLRDARRLAPSRVETDTLAKGSERRPPGQRSGELTRCGGVNEGLRAANTDNADPLAGYHSGAVDPSARRLEELCSSAEALLFDLDGTLADTMPLHFEAWQHVLGGRGVTLRPRPLLRDGRRARRARSSRACTEEQGVALDFDELVVRKEAALPGAGAPGGPARAGVLARSVLPGKEADGDRLGRDPPRGRADARPDRRDGFFATVVTAEDTEHASPIPSRSCSPRRGSRSTRRRASCSRTAIPGSRPRAPPACRSSTCAKNGGCRHGRPRLKSFVDRAWDASILPALQDYVRIPNQSPLFDPGWREAGHMERAVELVTAWIRQQAVPGLKLDVVRLPGRTPLIVAEVPGRGDDTVLLYGHLDKQPPMEPWAEGLGPWTPTISDGTALRPRRERRRLRRVRRDDRDRGAEGARDARTRACCWSSRRPRRAAAPISRTTSST